MKMTESQKVAAAAWRIRRYALQMGEVQGQGYIGQALGYADVLATAFSHAMTYRPEDPEWEGRDRFLLSHGHYAIAYYAALLEAGIIPEAELETYGSDDSRLPMSRHGDLHPGDGDVRRLAGAGAVHCRRHGAWAAAETEQGLGLQLHVRWGAGRRVDLGGSDVGGSLWPEQPD
ncbi:transketolase [Klebsiella pneumoniae]|uniref:Transketolase n=1 Tax=Klebsiella pneumoniae TaxID=573 RepID=A0A377TTV8_KLEPN|nr:transketolase [Klebsiella pneumoniae]